MHYLNFIELKHIRDEDEDVVGKEIVNLAKLKRANLPVADGLVVIPPEGPLTKTNVPDELIKLEKLKIDSKKIWKELIAVWEKSPVAQIVFFCKVFKNSGRVFIDPYTSTVDIQIDSGKLSESLQEELAQIVRKADRRLVFGYIYYWVYDNGLKIVRTVPLTPVIPEIAKITKAVKTNPVTPKRTKKTYTKCFFDCSEKMISDPGSDGIILNSGSMQYPMEEKIWKLVEVCESHPYRQIIFVIDKNKLSEDAQIFLFLRNKKQYLNLTLGISEVSSSEELAHIKRELASLQINRKGSLVFWLSVGSLESLVNMDGYLDVGIDGLIINLDKLSRCLGESDGEIKKRAEAMCKLLDGYINRLNKLSMPLLFSGNLLYNDEMIRFLVEKKVFGLVVNTSESFGVREYLLAVEAFYFNRGLS